MVVRVCGKRGGHGCQEGYLYIYRTPEVDACHSPRIPWKHRVLVTCCSTSNGVYSKYLSALLSAAKGLGYDLAMAEHRHNVILLHGVSEGINYVAENQTITQRQAHLFDAFLKPDTSLHSSGPLPKDGKKASNRN